ncbi:ATP-dependent DNA ligase [Candidatus Methanomassiliicoccus intestinalis]|uniref:ATP-dependent DNA ligase n=1 Tax=Candidatus Methanomassiliicoccus intestinalis TaxID=1406512 RepID=UPI0037DD5B66
MQYGDLVKVYEAIESTASRLEMADILANLFRSSDCKQIRTIVYMTQGNIVPDFYPEKLGMADKLYLRALSMATGQKASKIKELWDKEGDTGKVTELVFANKSQTTLFSQDLTLERVHTALLKICRADGDGSQDLKMKLLADILHDAKPNEAKYIARLATGRMRIGIAAQTVIDALAIAFATKADKPDIERAFNITSDLGLVGETLCTEGLDGVRNLKVHVGNPIRAMLAERLSSPEEILERLDGKAMFEYKYDGLRIQAHISPQEIKLYSRRLEDMTGQFPDVAQALREAFVGVDAIVEGECVPIDINTGEFLPFQEVSHRRGRKHALDEAIEDYPVRFHLFDCLYLNGEDLTLKSLPQRRESLSQCIQTTASVRLSEARIFSSAEEVQTFFLQALADGCEGLMAKSVGNDSIYRAGARGYLWIKYKKEYRSEMNDTVDLVAVGAFYGRGKRGGTYGALLMATYNPDNDMFETVCKLGSGFNDMDLATLPEKLNKTKIDARFTRVNSKLEADVWFEPALVLEVRGAEITLSPIHTCESGVVRDDAGFAIRFPRFTGTVRVDKDARGATTSSEIMEMYRKQLKQSN